MNAAPARVVLGMAGLAVGAVAMFALREATMTVHQPVNDAVETEITMHASTHRAERRHSVLDMVEGVFDACRLQVPSDPAGPIEPIGDNNDFRVVLRPAIDRSDRLQLRGCLEDWIVDHVHVDVTDVTDR